MKRTPKRETLLVALGGNALIRKGEPGTVEEQFRNLMVPIGQIARLSRQYNVIITHGNGPQVGNLLLQQECCHEVPKLPLEILVSQTQGQIGYMIESTLDSALMKMGVHTGQHLVSLLSYVVVDENDPAFKEPSKPIGPIFSPEAAVDLPYPTRKTSKGYRRVVASPEPVTIVERQEIRELIDMGFIVICCGGGGIPVVREGRAFSGVDAVIDKDLASAKLAEEVGLEARLWTSLGTFFSSPGFADERLYTFLARDVRPVERRPDDDEDLTVVRYDLSDLFANLHMVEDAKTLAVLCLLRHTVIADALEDVVGE